MRVEPSSGFAGSAAMQLAGFPVLTLDIDWAPDFVIDHAADILIAAGVKATWFVTHDSPAIDRLRRHASLFELGLHPNFMAGSSHGANPGQVIAHCAALVPDATCMRTHGLVQSTRLFAEVLKTLPNLCTDLSVFLPRARNAEMHELPVGGRSLQRLPYIWEDDIEMTRPDAWWSLDQFGLINGLAIFDFHPIHVYMNAPSFDAYEQLKQAVATVAAAKQDDIPVFAKENRGPGFLFHALVAFLAAAGRSYCVRDVTAAVRNEPRLST